jgi:dinuclear metal center YbgI/SA1388 family protein
LKTLAELAESLDALLDVRAIPDDSKNGLQVEGRREVRRIAFALDACLETIREAAARQADLLVVHHGLLWKEMLRACGTHGARLAACFTSGLSLYAVHLPLDAHTSLGNNVSLIEDAGFVPFPKRIIDYHGYCIGYLGECADGLSIEAICANLERTLFCRPSRILGAHEGKLYKKAAAVSGGALFYAEEAARAGAELYITGEGSHSAYHQAIECGITTLIYGHYTSEMIGIRRLEKYCRGNFGLETTIIDCPTGY